uniref:Aldehyde dehydrogenase n=1 Tax=Suidasia medanensis TaxID=223625 RepID=A7XZK3_9ACAR|nr:aldehyde dehydrogenase [Suidasia medanensis]
MAKVEVKYTKIFINNEWLNSVSGKTFATINPTTEEKLADIQEGDKDDINKAVEAAVAAFKLGSEWRNLDASARGRLINKFADLIQRDIEYLARLETADNGKPYTQALGDIQFAIGGLRYYAGWADKIHGKTVPADGKVFSYTKIEPVGVCGQIIPWNYPIPMLAWKLGPALACGNTLVVKPAEQTPLTALYIASLVVEAGFPPGVINIVPGYGPTAGGALVEHPNVDKIAFTGSTEVGKLIMKNGSGTLKRVSLELGGKSPLVVTKENFRCAKPRRTSLKRCALVNMGQCCAAATRTFVHESIYDQFVNHFAQLAQKRLTMMGDPFEKDTQHGPQIDDEQANKILGLIESGKKEGARVVAGGKRAQRKGYFIEPTVFADVTDQMRIAREEIFGPVQQILKYKTLDEVIERANNTTYGLAAGILTNDLNQALKYSSSVRAGSVWVNTYLHVAPQTPFGGFKQSGHEREMGEDGLKAYCEIKTVTIGLS